MAETTARASAPSETVNDLFGAMPEDVISPIKSAADALGWIEEILITIQREVDDPRNRIRVRLLAEAAAYLASDVSNYAGHMHETYLGRLQTAGLAPAAEPIGLSGEKS